MNPMDLADFDYHLPQELIAQRPAERRDDARLMVIRRADRTLEHRRFSELPALLAPEDLLVLNNTRVFPARLFGRKPGGARVEVLLLREQAPHVWEALARPGRRCPAGSRLVFGDEALTAEVLASPDPAKRLLRFSARGDFWELVERLGQVPLPPYIRRPGGLTDALDRSRYQTVFAHCPGSVAAPTAGLHFTQELLARLRHCMITLHVGYGTFKPIHARRIEDHRMEAEYYRIGPDAVERIQECRRLGGRVVAVGTTTTRALETAAASASGLTPSEGWTELFIRPGHRFRLVDALITNFHLPRSTLLVLVAALADRELVLSAYREAVRQRYRFYSYGDAMLIL
jgi:S-adenosylmethionine:tRNA ribosyltransferase-isomerase